MKAQIYEMARRSVIQTLRQPALIIPPIVFPLIMMAINTRGLNAARDLVERLERQLQEEETEPDSEEEPRSGEPR